MKLKELVEKLKIKFTNADLETEVSGLCYDSRQATEGYVFVAIKGLESDGHKFIPNAVEKGASVVICEEAPSVTVPYVLVEDSRLALAYVSAAWFAYPAAHLKIIGVTGTSGKTTSTNLIRHILAENGATVGLIGTNGNWIDQLPVHTEHTTPDSFELNQLFRSMADAGCTHVVMEVSSHALALDRVAGIEYSTAAFTNLSQDHLDFHGSMEEYAAAKRKLFSMCKTACLNLDDEWATFMMHGMRCRVLTTSTQVAAATIKAADIEMTASGISFTAVTEKEDAKISLGIPGMFSVYNALTAISVCMAEGISLRSCAAALATASGVKGRVENVPTAGDYSIIIDYSHKPDALEKVLKTLRPVTRGRLICLFGCGGDRDRLKRPVMGKVAADHSDLVIVTSDNPRTEVPEEIISEILKGMQETSTPYDVICDRVEAIHHAIDIALPGDVILLAGKGHEDYQIIGHTKYHLDEREVVAQYYREKNLL